MNSIAAIAILACANAIFYLNSNAQTLPVPIEVAQAQPQARLSGRSLLRVWGMEIYEARLWANPGFALAQFDQHPFALELEYRRALKGHLIAERSLREMQRQAELAPQQAQQWQARLQALFPDVRSGDRITGLHLPGVGVHFVHNGRVLGTVEDPQFARLFFGIWLSPQTSEPQLRCALAPCA